jgi:hypothetical protein
LALERVIKVDLLLEDDIDATREFFLDECTSDGRVLLPSLSQIVRIIPQVDDRYMTDCALLQLYKYPKAEQVMGSALRLAHQAP